MIALVRFLGGVAWLVGSVLGLGTLWFAARAAPAETRPVALPLAPLRRFRADPQLTPTGARSRPERERAPPFAP